MHVLVIPDVMDSRVVQDCRSDTVEMVSSGLVRSAAAVVWVVRVVVCCSEMVVGCLGGAGYCPLSQPLSCSQPPFHTLHAPSLSLTCPACADKNTWLSYRSECCLWLVVSLVARTA